MTTTQSPAATLVTIELGATHEDSIAELHRQVTEANVAHKKRFAERRRQAGADAAFLVDNPSADPELAGLSEEVRERTNSARGWCRDHQHRSIETWLGISPDIACCHQALGEAVRDGRVIITNVAVLGDFAADESHEKFYRLQADFICNAVRERVDEISARLLSDLQALVAAGGEPVERLREVLRQVLGEAGDVGVQPVTPTVAALDLVDEPNGSVDRSRKRRWA